MRTLRETQQLPYRRPRFGRRKAVLDYDPLLAALALAWRTTALALMLFLAMLALAPYWDTAIFLHALRDTLTSETQ